jgi:hypothetical protein
MGNDLFDSLNGLQNLTYLTGNSPEEIVTQIKSIRLPVRIISIYAMGSKHICWVETTAKLNKVSKKDK